MVVISNTDVTIDGDSNTTYTEVQNGSSNNIDVQIHDQAIILILLQ